MWTFLGEISAPGHAKGNVHNAHSDRPVGVKWGRGWWGQAFARTRLEWCEGVDMKNALEGTRRCAHHVCGTGTVVFKRQRKSRSTSFLLDKLCWSNVCLILTAWSFGIHPEALAT
jgi:hypothetical protein